MVSMHGLCVHDICEMDRQSACLEELVHGVPVRQGVVDEEDQLVDPGGGRVVEVERPQVQGVALLDPVLCEGPKKGNESINQSQHQSVGRSLSGPNTKPTTYWMELLRCASVQATASSLSTRATVTLGQREKGMAFNPLVWWCCGGG